MAIVPKSWMPKCDMKRIIVHWTAGANTASKVDKEHYHIIVESDGKLIRGDRTIEDNVSTKDDVYAAHTKGTNTKSIGVSAAAMAGAIEKPFNAGPFPMTKVQWEQMALVVAELAKFYEIPLTNKTILGHGEVQNNLGVAQNGKWDPMVLPWKPDLTKTEAGNLFRDEVAKHMA